MYYACFYMASALLLKNGLYAKTHSGTKTLFQKEFILTGIADARLGRVYQQLFELRNEGDYVDLVHVTEQEVAPFLAQTKEFLKQIKSTLDPDLKS